MLSGTPEQNAQGSMQKAHEDSWVNGWWDIYAWVCVCALGRDEMPTPREYANTNIARAWHLMQAASKNVLTLYTG